MSATLSARVQKRIGTVATCVLGLSASAAGLAGLGLAAAVAPAGGRSALLFWAGAALFQVGVPLYGPTVPTMLLQCVPRHRRGAIMGLDSSLNTVARIAAMPLLGSLYQSGGPAACFGVSSSMRPPS